MHSRAAPAREQHAAQKRRKSGRPRHSALLGRVGPLSHDAEAVLTAGAANINNDNVALKPNQ